MADAPFTATIGPNVTIKDSGGATLLTPITGLSLSVTGVSSSTPASGSATVAGNVLEMSLSIPAGSVGGAVTDIGTLTDAVIAMTSDGSRVAYVLTPGADTTLTLSGGVAGKLCEAILEVKQGATAYTVTLPSNATVIGTVSVAATANAITYLRFITTDGGTTYTVSTY